MRTDYLIPLQSKVVARIGQLDGDIAQATGTAHRRKLQKEQDELKKQRTELTAYDEKLRHAADQRVTLDLDDGVKVNYAKFGKLLAELDMKGKVAFIADDFDESLKATPE